METQLKANANQKSMSVLLDNVKDPGIVKLFNFKVGFYFFYFQFC